MHIRPLSCNFAPWAPAGAVYLIAMITFCIALALLIGGYFTYGTLVTRIFGQDPKRPTPVCTMADGVDYVELPTWKIFLIQFLNIAGLGPIFGAIMGVMYGPAAFLWIVLGTIFAGGVHDYLSGSLSLRMNGASLPEVVGSQLGARVKNVMRVFALLLLVLLGAVFVYNPAELLARLTGALDVPWWVVIILAYYVAATLLPIDKVIGKLYPIFGFALLFMAAGLGVMLFVHSSAVPEVWEQFYNHKPDPAATPIFPIMFVTIACGAISGFHATQSPLMARCLKNESHAKPVFYGAMVAEGIVALVWAAAAVAFTGGYEQLGAFIGKGTPAPLVDTLSRSWLGTFGGILAILGVVVAPITSGDTALRSARLIAADFMKFEQHTLARRLMVSVPIFVLCGIIMLMPYDSLWRYFAWSNQVLAVFTLWAASVWLARHGRCYWVALVPAVFMTMVVTSYIFFAPEGFTLISKAATGHPIPYWSAMVVGGAATLLLVALFIRWKSRLRDIEAA